VHEKFSTDEIGNGWIEFTPDCVMALTHKGIHKTLLFFLEVDMGTETLASPKRTKVDVRQKVVNYQTYLRFKRYRRYEHLWNCSLNGFRLLFLAYGPGRLASLCRLVRDMPPSDFIWLTDRRLLLSKGVWADIWSRGGRHDVPPQSILGSQMPELSPTPVTDRN